MQVTLWVGAAAYIVRNEKQYVISKQMCRISQTCR